MPTNFIASDFLAAYPTARGKNIMKIIKRLLMRFCDIRERKPDCDIEKQDIKLAGASENDAEVTVIGYSEEIAAASKGVFAEAVDGAKEKQPPTQCDTI